MKIATRVAALASIAGIAALSLAGRAAAEDDVQPGRGLEFGVRTGYAVPISYSEEKPALREFSGLWPIWLNAGYRIDRRFYVGGYFQYGYGIMSRECSKYDCSGDDLRFGIEALFYFWRGRAMDFWAGLGTGVEIAHLRASDPKEGRVTVDMSGPEFARVEVGGDYRVSSHFGLGPFVSMSLARFGGVDSSAEGHLHVSDAALRGWLSLGFRGVFNL